MSQQLSSKASECLHWPAGLCLPSPLRPLDVHVPAKCACV